MIPSSSRRQIALSEGSLPSTASAEVGICWMRIEVVIRIVVVEDDGVSGRMTHARKPWSLSPWSRF
jgi:hypothetical protein